MTSRPSRILRTTVLPLVVVAALSSCTSIGGGADSASPAAADQSPPAADRSAAGSETTEGAGAPPPSPRPAPPPRKACYRLDFDAATQPTNDSRPVPCSRRHTAQTYFVGRLDTVVDGHLLAVDSRLAQRQLERTCPRKLDEYVGGTELDRALSRVEAVWFSPTIEQSDQGASWFRCDAVALGRASQLAPLPAPGRLRGLLNESGALDEVGLCGTAAPGTRGFERVICSRRHAWRAINTIDISGGDSYPGVAQVREAGETTCRDQVEAASGSPDQFSYGWEWPTREQWRAGQHHGYCWAPD